MPFDSVSVVCATEPKQKMFCSILSYLISAAMLLVDTQKT